jgi:hypothetical protein
VRDLENVNIKVFALGGDQSMATAMFNGDFEALRDFLTQGADIRTGVPLSYVVRNVLDNSIVNVKVATDYDVKTCVPIISERLYSGFGQGVEGWTSYDNGTGHPVWNSEADCMGGMGGCIKMGDATTGFSRYRAPFEWRDEKAWSAFHGGQIKYHMKSTGSDSWGSIGSDLMIQGPNGTLILSLPDLRAQLGAGWTHVIVNLDEAGTAFGDVTVKWQFGGQDATADQIEAVLANVTDFLIKADHRSGYSDYTWLDEVEVVAPGGGGSSER